MIYGSVCSGIEAATVAWGPLGWKAAWFSEIEAFPNRVLAHHYPGIPNLGDMTKIYEKAAFNERPIDVLIGGTPCQSFSIAGLRAGLDSPNGNLALEFLKILDRKRPKWVVWENVPGVLSSWSDVKDSFQPGECEYFWKDGQTFAYDTAVGAQTNDFDTFLAGLSELGYGLAWRILDAQYFGVPQRRRRVFVVGYLGELGQPTNESAIQKRRRFSQISSAVLFERYSLCGNSPPSRPAGKEVAGTLGGSSQDGGFRTTDLDNSGAFISEISPAVTKKWAKGTGGPSGDECQNLVIPPLTSKPYSDNISQEERLIINPQATSILENHPNDSRIKEVDVVPTLSSRMGTGGGNVPMAFKAAIGRTGSGKPSEDTVASLMSQHKSGDPTPLVAFKGGQGSKAGGLGIEEDKSPTLGSADSGSNRTPVIASIRTAQTSANGHGVAEDVSHTIDGAQGQAVVAPTLRAMPGQGPGRMADDAAVMGMVRRLTPRECERLQGFPDDYTLIPGKAKGQPDGPRYKALGNSMAVPVIRWIGERIELVEGILKMEKKGKSNE
jgi:DNA (cytosine-5)-methyltransferase 1